MSFRTKRRFTVFTAAYAILLTWMVQYIRSFMRSPLDLYNNTLLVTTIGAGAVMSIIFAWWLAHSHRDDISVLKCIGWSNHNIRELVLGEVFALTLSGLIALTLLAVALSGLYFTWMVALMPGPDPWFGPSSVLVPDQLKWWVVNPILMWMTFGVLMFSQVPGILILTWRILRVSPMLALTRPE
jgi:predicted lysophospholipase L1 biosynthesis ABC-type transport system permease subunit